MGNRVQWIEHKGKKILSCDYSNIQDEEEFIRAIVETEEEVLKQAPGTLILMLIDVTGSHLTLPPLEGVGFSAAASELELLHRGAPRHPDQGIGFSPIVAVDRWLGPDRGKLSHSNRYSGALAILSYAETDTSCSDLLAFAVVEWPQ